MIAGTGSLAARLRDGLVCPNSRVFTFDELQLTANMIIMHVPHYGHFCLHEMREPGNPIPDRSESRHGRPQPLLSARFRGSALSKGAWAGRNLGARIN